MSITKMSQWVITCGECCDIEEVSTGDSDVFTQVDAIKEFRIRGWKIGKECKCPKCDAYVATGEEVKDE